jgi:metal-responsive CopG/Arc/MetJ family transcriptional regulator
MDFSDRKRDKTKRLVQVQIEGHVYDEFDKLCSQYGISKSEVLRRAIIDFILQTRRL